MNKILLAAVFFRITFSVCSQNIETPYQVGAWKGFAKAAITYTFDDGCANQKKVAIPMLNEYKFCATFFPVINWSPDWSALQTAVNVGHEVGSHTVSHTKLSTLNDAQQTAELSNSLNEINTRITGQKCLTVAYPNCDPGNQTISEKYYIAARHCQGNIETTTPSNFYTISSIVCGIQGSVQTAQDFQSKADAAALSNGWCVYLIHGIDGDGGYSDLSSTVLRASFDYLNSNKSKFWVSTFTNVARYIRERNSVSLSVTENIVDTIKIKVTDTLNNNIYNIPVTFRRPLPNQWPNAVVKQNGTLVDYKIVDVNSVKYIEFNVVPDNGIVSISKSNEIINSSKDLKKTSLFKISPNPFNETLKIETVGEFSYQILTIEGKEVEGGRFTNSAQIGRSILPGTYILKIKKGSNIDSKTIIKL